MLIENITEGSIKSLIDTFYQKVRSHKELGPIFSAVIGEGDAAWKPHLETMYAFWSSVMLTSGRYQGDPLLKHKNLPPFDEHMFDIWLRLFAEAANQLHTKPVAELYIDRSRRIAKNLRLHLYHKPGRA